MDVTNIEPQLERLDGQIDNLEEVLQPLLGNLSEVSSKLPLLDKAKLYILVTYAVESMLFSALRLNGVNAKEHPVFKELTRVRQYFDKIAQIELPPPKPEQTLHKEAAIRFIRADLADNKEVNTKLSEMIAKEKAKAAFNAAKAGAKRKADDVDVDVEKESSGESEDEAEAEAASGERDLAEEAPAAKKPRWSKADKKAKKKAKKAKSKKETKA